MQATNYHAIDALIEHRYPRTYNYERTAALAAAKSARRRRRALEDRGLSVAARRTPVPRFRALLIRLGIVGA